MGYPHVIRLRGPWQLDPLQQSAGESTAGEQVGVQVPSDWRATLGQEFCGAARYTRYFNRPTGLDAQEQVWLCCDGARQLARVILNGQYLGEFEGGGQVEITAHLAVRNELWIEVISHDAGAPAGLIGEVRLEIRRAT